MKKNLNNIKQFIMSWWIIVVFLSVVTSSNTINRPVYKIILTQRGYTQFLQYDEIPPLREFTFCIWIRVYNLDGDQSIFTYIANGNHRLLRLWLRPGGKLLNFSIYGKTTTTVPVDIAKDVWRQVCLTYQSDYGAWGIYIDSKLLSCETRQSLYNVVLPGGGSIILGYGTANNGTSNGFEGELFGANLLLKSTIEGNNIAVQDYLLKKKHFHRNKIRESDRNVKYVILSQLENNKTQNSFENVIVPNLLNQKPSLIEHEIDSEFGLGKLKLLDESNEKKMMTFPKMDKIQSISVENKIKFRGNKKQFGLENKDLPVVSEYKTQSSPIFAENQAFYNTSYNINEKEKNNQIRTFLPDVEIPPHPQLDNKVYGQWTSSKFAGSVLNYLKSINYRKPERKPKPVTIQLTKINDYLPYASDFKITKIRPPVQFQRRSSIDYKRRIHKRGVAKPQINLEQLGDDLRSTNLKVHAKTQKKKVVVTKRGYSNKTNNQKSSFKEIYHSVENITRPKPFLIANKIENKNKATEISENLRNKKCMSILPFIKSLHYLEKDSQKISPQNISHSSDMYLKSFSNRNKWHNVKSYSNDYTPRRINIETEGKNNNLKDEIAETNLLHPYVRLKYRPETVKLVNVTKDSESTMTVPNQLELDLDTISIINDNNGNLPSQEILKNYFSNKSIKAFNTNPKNVTSKNSFNQRVKLGNTLNEHLTIGKNEEQKMQSLIGVYDNVPDINKYSSDVNNGFNIPSTENVKVCRKPEPCGRKLYIQRDGSIISSYIESPIRKKNIAIEFVQQNYMKCSLEESYFAKSYLIFIDWSNTPVRLFGGAFPKTTTDLCGFF